MALSLHTDNLIWGCAENPHSRERSCGGSSGGDAGLVAARCAPVGLGTDIGGSLRFPAAFCGVYGLKPSTYRLSKHGCAAARKERFNEARHLQSTPGPMGSTADDLVVAMKVLCGKDEYLSDPFITPCPWNDEYFLSV